MRFDHVKTHRSSYLMVNLSEIGLADALNT